MGKKFTICAKDSRARVILLMKERNAFLQMWTMKTKSLDCLNSIVERKEARG